jgi:hypothetical protein
VSFPFDLNSAAVSDSHLPCFEHAVLLMATARLLRDSLWAACPCVASSGYHTDSTKVVIRSIPISDAGGWCITKRLSWTRRRVVAAQYKKDDLLSCWTSSLDISGYHVDFHDGNGTIGAWQGHGMACVN